MIKVLIGDKFSNNKYEIFLSGHIGVHKEAGVAPHISNRLAWHVKRTDPSVNWAFFAQLVSEYRQTESWFLAMIAWIVPKLLTMYVATCLSRHIIDEDQPACAMRTWLEPPVHCYEWCRWDNLIPRATRNCAPLKWLWARSRFQVFGVRVGDPLYARSHCRLLSRLCPPGTPGFPKPDLLTLLVGSFSDILVMGVDVVLSTTVSLTILLVINT